MKAHESQWPIEDMARVLGVSRSGYYSYYRWPPSQRQQENDMILQAIWRAFKNSRETYGSPRIHAELAAQAAANLLQQDFSADAPNEKWVADMSYIRTMQGWLYIAVVIDLFSRKVVGLSMGNSLHAQLVVDELNQALKRRQPQAGLQHHSDQGCQYTSQIFQELLNTQGIICSMSRAENCYDNAAMEIFFFIR